MPMPPVAPAAMAPAVDPAFPFPPRAAVVNAPLPTQANRDILPMSTGVPILPTQSAQITGRPQTLVFKIGRFVISNAGTAGGVIYDEGTVSSCENLDPIGNLRDFDWNFQKLWLSPAMKERRQHAANGCFCTHESNSYYPSLPFNPGHLIQIKKLEREMKKARREIDGGLGIADNALPIAD